MMWYFAAKTRETGKFLMASLLGSVILLGLWVVITTGDKIEPVQDYSYAKTETMVHVQHKDYETSSDKTYFYQNIDDTTKVQVNLVTETNVFFDGYKRLELSRK